MQQLGTEGEMKQAWQDLLAQLSPEDRAEVLAHSLIKQRLAGIPPEQRLAGIPRNNASRD